MADKTIWDYPTLAAADPNDLILMASDEETYNMKVETLKNAMGEAASKPPVIRSGYWYVWSAAQEDYVNTGTAATGPRGAKGDKGDTGDITPAAQQAVTDAQSAASNAASSASSASASQQAAAQSAQEAASAVSGALPKSNVYNGLDKTASGFALDARQGKVLNEAIQGKQNTLTFDSTPTANSTNPVTSGGVKTALNAKLDSANVYNALDKTASGFALDARQGKALNDNLAATQDSLAVTQSSIAIIVNGDTASMAVPVGGYAYIKNNTHGLSDGLYTNTSSSAFPTSGGTANSSVFTKVTNGGLNTIQQATAFKKLWSGSVGQNTVITLSESITYFKAVLVVAKSNVGTAETRIIPVDAINYISSQQTTPDNAWVVGVMYQSGAYAMTLIGFMSDTQIYVMDRNVVSGWSDFYVTAVYGMN